MVTVHDNVLHILLTCTEGDETAVKEAMDWLQIYKQPQSRVFELWQRTVKYRLKYIHSTAESVTMADIIQKWPRYGDHDGHLLV